MRRKTNVGLFIVIIVAMVAVGYFLFAKNSNKNISVQNKQEKEYINWDKRDISIQLFDEENFVFVTQKNDFGGLRLGQDYIAYLIGHQLSYSDSIINRNKEVPPIVGKDEYFKVVVYDLNHLSDGPKEIDILSQLGKNNRYRGGANSSMKLIDGQDYLQITVKQSNLDIIREKVLDLNTGKLFDPEQIGDLANLPTRYPSSELEDGGVERDLTKRMSELYNLDIYPGRIESGLIENGKIDITNTNFATLYPEIASQLSEGGQIYFRPQQYSAKEWFDKVLYWFAPKGQDVLEVYATDPKTGEKTQIHSYDELMAWSQAHPEE